MVLISDIGQFLYLDLKALQLKKPFQLERFFTVGREDVFLIYLAFESPLSICSFDFNRYRFSNGAALREFCKQLRCQDQGRETKEQ